MTEILVKTLILIGGVMGGAAYLVLLERRVAAWIQDRIGPNRVGIPLTKIRMFGLGQPVADGMKFILKEEHTPAHVDKRLFGVAPLTIFVAALATFAVVPFGSVLPSKLFGWQLSTRPIELVVAPGVDVAMIYVFALSSIAVYGVILGGWASNNKYSFLGGLRSSAQLVAYELPSSLGLLGVAVAAGSLDLREIILVQAKTGWFALVQPLGLVVFTIAAFAEAARLPFDLPECEQELVGGYHTEYSGMKLMLYLTAEFVHMIIAAFLLVILFLGGWHFPWLTGAEHVVDGWGRSGEWWPWLQAGLRVAVLLAKVLLVILFFMLVRWTWPRFRYDQLMALAWKVMLPLGLINLVTVAVLEQLKMNEGGDAWLNWLFAGVAWAVLVVAWIAVSLADHVVSDNRPQADSRITKAELPS
jgi:NADH-quinone oxidoreductase subunit H